MIAVNLFALGMKAGRGIIEMRVLGIVALCAALAGCEKPDPEQVRV
jgi:hypothetical protein